MGKRVFSAPEAAARETSGPAAGSSIASGTAIGVVVTALDTDGDPVSSFNGTVNVPER